MPKFFDWLPLRMLTLVPKILQLKSSKTLNPVLFLLVLGSNFCIYIFSFVFVAGGCFHHKYMEIQPLLQQLVNLAGHCSQGGTDQFSPIILTVFLNTSPRPPWPPPRRPSRRPPVVHESVEPGGNLGGNLGETWGKPPERELSFRLKLLRFQSQLGRNL